MRDIDRELRQAPREAHPERDLWPGIEARLGGGGAEGEPEAGHDADRERRPAALRWLRAAALFAAGVALGALWGTTATPDPAEDSPPARAPATAPAETGDDAGGELVRAIEVQRAGSEYLAALGRLHDLPDTATARRQGYEAALVVVDAAVREVAATGGLAVPTDPLVRQAGQARRAAARRVADVPGVGR